MSNCLLANLSHNSNMYDCVLHHKQKVLLPPFSLKTFKALANSMADEHNTDFKIVLCLKIQSKTKQNIFHCSNCYY